jgi:hypothetical protein
VRRADNVEGAVQRKRRVVRHKMIVARSDQHAREDKYTHTHTRTHTHTHTSTLATALA